MKTNSKGYEYNHLEKKIVTQFKTCLTPSPL